MDVSKPAKLGKIYPQKTVLHRLPIKMFYTWKNKYITEIKKQKNQQSLVCTPVIVHALTMSQVYINIMKDL